MIKVKSVLLVVCCSMIMSGCFYEQKRKISSAAPVASEHSQPSDATESENGVSRSVPVQEAALPRLSTQPVERPGVAVADAERIMPSVEYVTGRISEYNKKIDRWRKRDSQAAVLRIPADESEKMVDCFRELQKVLNGYNRLHDILLRQGSMPINGTLSAQEVYELQQSDIAFVDGFCGQVVAGESKGLTKSEEPGNLSSVEAVIAQHAANGKFEELVQAWNQMPETTAAKVSMNTKILYGKALMALQQEEEAIKVFRQMVDQMASPDGQAADLLSVRKILADLYTASGHYRDAEAQYLEISKEYKNMVSIEDWAILQRSMLTQGEQGGPELKDYSDLLKNYLGFSPARDGYTVVWQADKFLQTYPHSPVASNVDLIRTAAREQADKWSNKTLITTDKPAAKKPDQDVLVKRETTPEVIVSSPAIQPQISPNSGEPTTTKKVESEAVKLEKTHELERRWKEGIRLMEEAQYDKAIEIFTPMLETEYAAKADKKIAEASLLAAEAERRKAADFFIRFTKAPDVESRKKLLIESRKCLLDILVKYPEVEITEKVRGNIKRVEKEMNAIDPNLIQQTGRVGGEEPKAVGKSTPKVPVP
ncbi:MAG: tetratricopeptide repeat protein [Deltaproteobacteria bacterium]|nr:tetratricopeptide repeat protein [Deltaproteobacteria bacterium]